MKPEQRTRQEKIDLQLGRAGWAIGSRHLTQEYLVTSSSLKDTETPYKTKNEFADYALTGRLDQVLAIVEAKRSMFVRTQRKAVMQKAEISSLDALRQPPFTAIGDPEGLFGKSELEDLLELTRSVAA